MPNKKGFTLIELIIVIAIIVILAAIIYVAINPGQRIRETNNARRWIELDSIAKAIKEYEIDHVGQLPSGISQTLKMIGTDTTGCDIDCGSTSEIVYSSQTETKNYYSNNFYTYRNWFEVSSIDNFNSLNVSAVLDCDGNCSGQVRVRIGNASSYADYDFVNAASVRTDGTTSNYSWYTHTYPISKATLGNSFFVQMLKYTGSGTIRFLMDELGPAGPYPEYRSDSNGDGSHTGWFRDNGDYFIKIGIPEMTAAACLDLSSSLVDQYFLSMPADPKDGTPAKTYYAIKETGGGNIKMAACHAEENEEITLTR